jgi:DNA phosphorothioation-associated putative methyltransferase
VIEDFEERIEALHGAYSLTKRVLGVAAMLASQATQPGRPYCDGFVTSRNTFQKYYTQAELAGFISEVLNEEPIPVSPGVFFVFRDKDLEQDFLAGRHRSVTLLQRLERPEPVRLRPSRPERIQLKYEAKSRDCR